MNYYNEIKNKLIDNEVYKQVKDYSKNKNDLSTYYEVGRLLSEAGKHYGEGIIKEYSLKLTNDLNTRYDASSLNKMRKFYKLIKKMATVSPNLSYSHYVELLPYDVRKVNYYIILIEKHRLSVRQLRERIKYKEYERLPKDTKLKLGSNNKLEVQDLVKNPIIINNPTNKEILTEKALKLLILENLPSFLSELGEGFSFINQEYKIKIGNNYNYIDLLLFNIKYNCYVVVIFLNIKITSYKTCYSIIQGSFSEPVPLLIRALFFILITGRVFKVLLAVLE